MLLTLTKDEAKEWLPIIQAFAEGKQLQMWDGFQQVELSSGTYYKPNESWKDIDELPLMHSDIEQKIENPSDWFRVKPVDEELGETLEKIIGANN